MLEPSKNSGRSQARSPFFSRTYGGFSPQQRSFTEMLIGDPKGKTILDPMAGQGDFLARFAWQGARVVLGDINPAVLLIAKLRDPVLLRQSADIAKALEIRLEKLNRSLHSDGPLLYSSDWLTDRTREELRAYGLSFGLSALAGSTAELFEQLRGESPEVTIAAGLPLLAARDLVTYRSSDNATWLKKGGLQRATSIFAPMLEALQQWRRLAERASDFPLQGTLDVVCQDLSEGGGSEEIADFLITSPPYANRLDYSRLWGPEIEVLSAMSGVALPGLKARQIGSTVVRGVKAQEGEENLLPTKVREVLEVIRADRHSKASGTYYYPFFKNYALGMRRAFRNLIGAIVDEGKLVVFVRNTVRKDIVFPTASLIESVLEGAGNMERLAPVEEHIVRKHIGLRRRREMSGIHGLAQQEFWLLYRKKGQ
jgi:hypothetical protein